MALVFGVPRPIERFEVRPGDCSHNQTFNDCQQDRQRSELSEKYKTTVSGQMFWYRWMIYIPPQFPNVFPTKVTLGQFHQTHAKPAWMFELFPQGYVLARHLRQAYGQFNPHGQLLIPSHQLRGQWHNIVVKVLWQRDKRGILKVWVDDKLKVNYQGSMMSAYHVYFKYGLYQAFISRYPHSKFPTQWVLYAQVCRSTTSLRHTLVCPD